MRGAVGGAERDHRRVERELAIIFGKDGEMAAERLS